MSSFTRELDEFLGPSQYRDELRSTAQAMVATGKGLLACDEPPSVLPGRMRCCWKDLDECDEAWRIKYRELMFTTPGLSDYVSGIILHEETVCQNMTRKGCVDRVPALLESMGMIPGVKVDQGFEVMPGAKNSGVADQRPRRPPRTVRELPSARQGRKRGLSAWHR